ncbi:DUF2062 domain-containing protein [bacterium SCSIO 12827]|nr:DUF2062 domain-containing protein [bacterium SCSIO 12827]
MRYKLLVPMKRSPHSPEYTARGVFWGVFWGLTPLVGIQMPLVTAHWLLFRLHPKTSFHLIQGLAWVWISNVFTMVPMYYGFYVTGQVMLGRIRHVSGYDSFAKLFNFDAWQEETFWETVAHYFEYVWEQFGLPLAIGWIPWALIGGWAGYRLSLKIIRDRRQRILAKRLRESLAVDDTAPSA